MVVTSDGVKAFECTLIGFQTPIIAQPSWIAAAAKQRLDAFQRQDWTGTMRAATALHDWEPAGPPFFGLIISVLRRSSQCFLEVFINKLLSSSNKIASIRIK